MSTNNYKYEVVLANTEESKQIHYKLRYQIFCMEKGFFLKDENLEAEFEKDLDDEKSVHFLIKHGNHWIGTFRLIINNINKLPLYKLSVPDSPNFTQDKPSAAEFSRLCILRPFQKINNAQPSHESARKESEIMLKVLHATRDYCYANNILQVIFLCRRSITRILKQLQLQAQQIGPTIFYYGPRIPLSINLTDHHDEFDALVNERSGALSSYSLYSNNHYDNIPQVIAA
jgi:N-acyl amino acid synthase of PEP-CTERM/exosortase system